MKQFIQKFVAATGWGTILGGIVNVLAFLILFGGNFLIHNKTGWFFLTFPVGAVLFELFISREYILSQGKAYFEKRSFLKPLIIWGLIGLLFGVGVHFTF